MSRKPGIQILLEGMSFRLWSRKIEKDMDKVCKALRYTDFSDGRKLKWGGGRNCLVHMLKMVDKEGVEHGIWLKWRDRKKGNGVNLTYSSDYWREIDSGLMDEGREGELQEEVKRFKYERKEMRALRDKYIEETGYDIAKVSYGKSGEDIEYAIAFYRNINGWFKSKEKFNKMVERLGLDLAGNEIKDKEENRDRLAELVKTIDETHEVVGYEKYLYNGVEELRVMKVKIPEGFKQQ